MHWHRRGSGRLRGLKRAVLHEQHGLVQIIVYKDRVRVFERLGFSKVDVLSRVVPDAKETTRFVFAAESGEHLFRLKGNRGYRVWIDGERVVDLWDIAWPTSTRGVQLEAGRTYALRVEALQTGWEGEQRLQWSRPGASDEAALAAAREADLVVFASGLTWEFEGEEMTVLADELFGLGHAGFDHAVQEAVEDALPARRRGALLRIGRGKTGDGGHGDSPSAA